MCKGSQELHVGVRILIDTYHSVGWIWVETKINWLFSCEGRKKCRKQLRDMNMTGTSDTGQAFTFSPPPLLSFTGDHFWITRNPLPFFPLAFPWPFERFCTATCCCDWGLRGLTAINAQGLVENHLTKDPCSSFYLVQQQHTWHIGPLDPAKT